jgi:putative membrane protein
MSERPKEAPKDSSKERPKHRRPATFRLDDPGVVVVDAEDTGRPARGTIQITPETEPALLPVPLEVAIPMRRGFPWGSVFWGSVTGLLLLGLGLSVTHLVEDLYARSEGLGFLGAGLATAAALALIVVIAREIHGLARLATIEKLHRRAAEVLLSDDRRESRAVVVDLLRIAHQNPRLARARAALTSHKDEIIDGADMIKLAERELMLPLDIEARRLVSSAAQRVSVVTAISPRALVDVLFVFAASLRLIRQLARLYGGRPGALGMISLLRHVIAHLAITGGMAASDSLIQQVLGHGIAAKLSQRLGEGVLNGLLTARLGLAAIDVTRPLPFNALPRPVLGDLAKDLLRKREEEE